MHQIAGIKPEVTEKSAHQATPRVGVPNSDGNSMYSNWVATLCKNRRTTFPARD